ncbi:MAG: hypothetical protein KGJ53_09325 [Alphaproteobacteria bacterium]|nr:hypothetical protein [Alphaproteobacteria bacterium]
MADDRKSLAEAALSNVDPVALAELSVHFDSARTANLEAGTVSPALLAAYLDGGLDPAESERVATWLAATPVEFHNALASVDYLENLSPEAAPRDLVEVARARLHPSGAVETLPAHRVTVPVERFMLLAAAGGTDSKAVLCRSQSGIWTLEVFVAPDDGQKGYLLLSVHPDHRDTYEGRTARIFTRVGYDERVLAEETVRAGEIYTPISLVGLDLHTRDAVNVIFGPPPP